MLGASISSRLDARVASNFGATTAAVAAVLAIFMAGLGLGSAILGKLADRVENPLRMYGVLEAVIAVTVSISPWAMALARVIYFRLGGQEALAKRFKQPTSGLIA